MSSYDNPLDKFASYSVHYIMACARSTEEAQVFTDPLNNTETLAAIERVSQLGEVIPYGSSKVAYLIMDTRRFSQFMIERVKYDVYINGLVSGSTLTNFKTQVELTIIDSVGISFINFIQYLLNEKMQTNFSGVVFLLRMIFVGHSTTGETETVQSITIPLIMANMELNLDFSKGVYNCSFLPYTNFNAVAYQHWLNVSNASTFFTGKGNNTLGGIIKSIETRLNFQSKEYFEKASTLLAEAGRSQNTKHQYGRLVKYLITIPKEWEGMIFTGAGTANSTETNFKELKNGKPIDSTMAVQAGEQLTDVLDLIFKQVKEIANLGSGKKSTNSDSVSFYKHIVSLSSDDNSITVHVDVIPFKVPNVVLSKKSDLKTADVEQNYQIIDGIRVPKNYFELDYIFTGKNTQILNFDMKLQNLSYFLRSNLNLGVDSIAGVQAYGQLDVPREQKIDKTSELVQLRAYDPIILPLNTEAELSNFSRYSSQLMIEQGTEFKKVTQDYTRNLSMFYGSAPVKLAITIKGNPSIMAKFTISDFVPNTDIIQESDKDNYRKKFEEKILKENNTINQQGSTFVINSSLGSNSYVTTPVFFKINIKGPNVDFITSETIMGAEFSKEVLYNNYYCVMSISNIIENGIFTQSLELWNHNVYGYGTTIIAKETKKI